MIAAAAVGALVGLVLGQRFSVLILLPAITMAVIAIAGLGMARAEPTATIVVSAVAAAVALQLGYVIGSALHRAVPPAHRPARRRTVVLESHGTPRAQ